MENEHVLAGLTCKQAEIAGELEALQARVTAMFASLEGLDTAIGLFAPDAELDGIAPRRSPAPPSTLRFAPACFPHASPAPARQAGEVESGTDQERGARWTMSKLTKRYIDALKPQDGRDVFAWDGELRGFGVRVKPSGVKTYLVQYRNAEGRTRRLVVAQHGVLAPEQARDLARQKLAAVAWGEDPSADRHAAREGMTVAEVCNWYLEQARSGRILGRKRRPIKASTLHSDESRIETHIQAAPRLAHG